jgi:serine protease AprX
MKCKSNLLQSQTLVSLTFFVAIAIFSGINGFADNIDTSKNRYWLFLAQKNGENSIQPSQKAVWRRVFRGNMQNYSWYDQPVNAADIAQIDASGARIRTVSRWLNAVSVETDSATLQKLRNLPIISKIKPVAVFKESVPQVEESPFRGPARPSTLDYGGSQAQVAQLQIDSLHNSGLTGLGITIGIMDTGFDTSHVCIRRINDEHRIIATRDFLNGDTDVMDLYTNQRAHGTEVLSCAGGFDEGHLIGTAFGANFVLAKTESLYAEIQAEEDYWVAASEWMESLGVDIISSSLGYTDWYDTTQLDGNTAVITQAADVAAALGVVVVNCAGNEGDNIRWRKVIPPADGDSVVAVGAVNESGAIASFSSRGPTADGRIKPDVCARGVSTYLANYSNDSYESASGTSFAAPLIAGGIALLLESHPDWTAMQAINAMKAASSRASHPDNFYGWGIPNFVSANLTQPYNPSSGGSIVIAPQPSEDSVVFHFYIQQSGAGVLSIHDLSGIKVKELDFGYMNSGTSEYVWDGANESGAKVASGIYICNLRIGDSNIRQKIAYIAH